MEVVLYATIYLVTLAGQGYDPEDGILTGEQLTWYRCTGADCTELGTGALLSAGPFTAGDHMTRLVVRDADGSTGAQEVTIHVGERAGNVVYLPMVMKKK